MLILTTVIGLYLIFDSVRILRKGIRLERRYLAEVVELRRTICANHDKLGYERVPRLSVE